LISARAYQTRNIQKVVRQYDWRLASKRTYLVHSTPRERPTKGRVLWRI